MDENLVFDQVYAFVVSLIVGLVWLSTYDLLKMARHISRCNYIVTAVCDILFWFIGTALIIFTALYFNGGFLRSYLFVGVFVGAILYFLTIGKVVKMIWKTVAKITSRVFVKTKTTCNTTYKRV